MYKLIICTLLGFGLSAPVENAKPDGDNPNPVPEPEKPETPKP